ARSRAGCTSTATTCAPNASSPNGSPSAQPPRRVHPPRTDSMIDTPGSSRNPGSDSQRSADRVPTASHVDAPDRTAEARAALQSVAPSLASLLRSVSDANASSVGTWTVGDVAAHVSHGFRVDIDAVAGRPVPQAIVTKAGIAAATAKKLAEDGERDPSALADRIDALAGEFDDVLRSQSAAVDWLQDLRLPPSAVACHLLNECLVHGHDIAKVTGRPWPIQRRHAMLAIEGFLFPLMAALPPTALVNQERAGSFRVRIDMRLRGGGHTLMVLDSGSLTLDTAGARDVDGHISGAPRALLLILMGRQGIWTPTLRGQLAAWGRRPWNPPHMLPLMSPP